MSTGRNPSFLGVSDLRLENCILWLGHSISVILPVVGSPYAVLSFYQADSNLRLFQPLSFCQTCLNLANEFKSHGEDKVLERQISTQTAKSLWKTDMKTLPHYNRKGCLGLWSTVMDLPEHVICLGNSFTEVGFYEILWS